MSLPFRVTMAFRGKHSRLQGPEAVNVVKQMLRLPRRTGGSMVAADRIPAFNAMTFESNGEEVVLVANHDISIAANGQITEISRNGTPCGCLNKQHQRNGDT